MGIAKPSQLADVRFVSNVAAGLLSLFPDLAAKNIFRIAGKDFWIAGKEDMTLFLAIIMAMSWP